MFGWGVIYGIKGGRHRKCAKDTPYRDFAKDLLVLLADKDEEQGTTRVNLLLSVVCVRRLISFGKSSRPLILLIFLRNAAHSSPIMFYNEK